MLVFWCERPEDQEIGGVPRGHINVTETNSTETPARMIVGIDDTGSITHLSVSVKLFRRPIDQFSETNQLQKNLTEVYFCRNVLPSLIYTIC